MSQATVDDISASDWTVALRHRRSTAMLRVGLCAAVGLVVTPLVGWPLSLSWVVAYALVSGLELLAFAPALARRPRSMGLFRRVVSCTLLFVNGCVFGGLSIPMWLIGGPLGGVAAALMLPSIMLFSTANAPRSLPILASSVAPQIVYLLLTPVFIARFGAPATLVTTSTAAVILYIVYVFVAWRHANETAESRRRMQIESDRLRARAEEELAAHTTFLAAIGHDLRTPIGAILTGASELQAGDAAARANASLITDAGLMMKALLDDLLDHSRIGAGRMAIEVQDFNLRAMLAQTLRLWHGPAAAKGLKLRVEGAGRMPAAVRGDAMRLRQVLNNLMSNAMKFTPSGSITLRLDAWEEEPSGYALLIEVIDTGPGMAAGQLARLFTPFDQTADGVSARYGGSGLGLAISRDLIQLMGGRLTARSAPGQGARFTVSLHLPRGEAATAPIQDTAGDSRIAIARALAVRPGAPVETVAARPDPEPVVEPVADQVEAGMEDEDRPLRVLVVDDHEINRRAVQLILQPLGCDIVTAADGLAALARCEETVFDVIFMDVRMPELDGRETTRRLRAENGPNTATPVVAVTADTAPEDVAACQAAGMAYFVSKPLTPQALLGALQHVLNETAGVQTEAA